MQQTPIGDICFFSIICYDLIVAQENRFKQIDQLRFEVVSHLSYNPNLVPNGFRCITKFKESIRKTKHNSDEEFQFGVFTQL